MKRHLIHTLQILSILSICILGACKDADPEFTVLSETDSQKQEAVINAFASGTFEGTEEHKKIGGRVLRRFGKALENESETQVRNSFSGKAFARYCFAASETKLKSNKKKKMMLYVDKVLPKVLTQQAKNFLFHETEVLKTELISESELVVYSRHWDDSLEMYSKMRWWLIKEDGDWKIYDFEDMDGVSRISLFFIMAIEGAGDKAEWIPVFQRIGQAVASADGPMEIDYTELEKDSLFLIDSSAPKDLKIVAKCIYLQALLDSEEYEKALSVAEQGIKDHETAYVLYQVMGEACFGLEKYDDAIEQYTIYSKYMGEDSMLLMNLSDIYFQKSEFEKSRELCLRGMKMNPRHAGCIASYAVLLKKEKWSDLLPLIEKTGKKLDAMEIIMDYAIFADKLDLARWMFDHFKKEFPQEEDLILYYEEEFSLDDDE